LNKILKIVLHTIAIVLLTLITQIGGIMYLIAVLSIKQTAKKRRLKRLGLFELLYLITTLLIVPTIAPLFGREKIKDTTSLKAHSFFYKLANRNYVRPELNKTLHLIATEFEKQNTGIKIIYLDANFPFIDKFPLLPHLSHNDGKKVDVTFVYKTPNGQLTNKKPSNSGYGVYEKPKANEVDQNTICIQRGNWQYDFPKYLTFGILHKDIEFSENATRELVKLIIKQQKIEKLFIEPHLKTRLNLNHQKVRFHGCQAVRHDDHIHFQLK